MPRDPKEVALGKILRADKQKKDVSAALDRARANVRREIVVAVDEVGVTKAQIARALITSEVQIRKLYAKAKTETRV